jgi:Kef-type K+ transport system membrane component KefB
LPESLQPYYPRILGVLLVGLMAWFVLSCLWNAIARRHDWAFVGSLILTCLLTATSFGVVHLFSSRYVMVAMPFVILAARPYFRPCWFACGRLAAGAAVGFMSMWTYVYR